MVVLDRIKELSKKKGWSLSFLASKLGLTASYFTDVKNGKTKISNDRLITIADILSTTPEYLKGETDIKEKPTSRSKPDYIIKFDSLPEKDRKEVIALIEYKAAHLHDERK